MKPVLSSFVLLLFCTILSAQQKKSIEALNISKPLQIDGLLIEEAYQHVQPAKDFLELQPHNGKPAPHPSEVYFFYDQYAIYIGAILYDNQPDSIFNYLTSRDNKDMADYFGVYFDPYNEGQLAYGFFITAAGVQSDIKAIKTNTDEEDDNWDAVWQSKTRITENGWTIEMRIPYSNLRFPDKDLHTWGLNIYRNIRRNNSISTWNFVDRKTSGFIHQQGEITGLKNIHPPLRLSFSPYISVYAETTGDNSGVKYLYRGGMDIKYGLSKSFTLDMMLIPDFGQIQSDDQQLNLSAYELYYDEQRQFFNEGTELFQRADIFYSRRIGAAPIFSDEAEENLDENEIVDFNPSSTRLANATKLSGRTKKGWGFGFLNAMSLPSYAEIKDTLSGKTREFEVQPFTNYNVVVIDKSMKNNSYFSLINTHMQMSNNPYKANVTAVDFQFRDNKKRFALSGNGGYSYKDEEDNNTKTGTFADIELEKNNGSLTYGIEQVYYSENYNPNDMGYLQTNNRLSSEAYIEYNILEPFWICREWYAGANWEYERIVNPNDKIGSESYIWTFFRFTNNSTLSINTGIESDQNDYDEARISGRYYHQPYHVFYNISYDSDFRKKISFGAYAGGYNHPETEEYGKWMGFDLDTRIGQKFKFEYDLDINIDYNDYGYADSSDDSTPVIYFGKRNVTEIENEIEMDYILTNKLALTFDARHYWSGVEYKSFYLLEKNGSLTYEDSYNKNQDTNYNVFNIDMMLTWHFAPGSEMNLAWKNIIFEESDQINKSLSNNIKNIFNAQATNTYSLKILYYIDYQTMKRLF